jgi:hypothetical protein
MNFTEKTSDSYIKTLLESILKGYFNSIIFLPFLHKLINFYLFLHYIISISFI